MSIEHGVVRSATRKRVLPSSKTVPAMNGMFENFPAAKSLDGRSGMIPSGPSMTGTKRKGWGNEAAVCSQASRSVAVSALCMHENVSPGGALAQAGTLEANVSHAISRREALNSGVVLAEPDSKI